MGPRAAACAGGGVLCPDPAELLHGEVLDPVVGPRDDNRQAVVPDLELRDVRDRGDVARAHVALGLLDWPGRVVEVRLSTAEFLEAAARATDRHGDLALRIVEVARPRRRDGE